ncbi:MAG: hypothetical protein ACI92Z_002536 [Paracoccaceae bacterium]|jgi:hypothetical protein
MLREGKSRKFYLRRNYGIGQIGLGSGPIGFVPNI